LVVIERHRKLLDEANQNPKRRYLFDEAATSVDRRAVISQSDTGDPDMSQPEREVILIFILDRKLTRIRDLV
jgi:hypothetical protein